MRAWIGSCVILAALLAAAAPSSAAGPTGSATIDWYTSAVVTFTLTPNYALGYGTVKATFGTQPTPAPGPGACSDGCAIDFGNILAGTRYLYKYAAHLNVKTNDTNGFKVYGEGAADFYNTADSSTQTLNQTLYYVNSTSGGTDSNTGFTAGFPFYKTAATNPVTGNSFSTAPTISYSPSPAQYPSSPIATESVSAGDLYYDYEIQVPNAATSGQYYVWIVYTVVPT